MLNINNKSIDILLIYITNIFYYTIKSYLLNILYPIKIHTYSILIYCYTHKLYYTNI